MFTISSSSLKLQNIILTLSDYIAAFFMYFATIGAFLGAINASRKLHLSMMSRLLKGPLSFFDTTPTGRILSRFANDVDTCDLTLPFNIRGWPNQCSRVCCGKSNCIADKDIQCSPIFDTLTLKTTPFYET